MNLKTVSLTVASILLALIGGIAVAGHWAIPYVNHAHKGDGILVFDAEIGMAPRPSGYTQRVDGPTANRPALVNDVYTDDRGARVDGPGQRSPAKLDILAIGCSFTWGHAVANPDTFVARLRRELGVPTSNFAMAGMGTVQSLQMLRRNRDLKPKLVIYGLIDAHPDRNIFGCAPSYYPFCFDVSWVGWDEAGKPRIERPISNGVRRFAREVNRDYMNPVSWLEHGIDVIWGRMILAWHVQHIVTDPKKKEEAHAFLMREMERTVAEVGAELLVVYIPFNFQPPADAVRRAVGKTRFLDVTDALRRHRDAGGPPLYIPDDNHPNALANGIIADEIARYIRREGLLK
jgi:hypothetical protein